MLKRLHRWHRKLAWVLLIPVTLWLVSGLTHPLMSNVFVAPAQQQVLLERDIELPAEGYVSLSALMHQHGLGTIDQARIIYIDNIAYYQLQQRSSEYASFKTTPSEDSQPNPHVDVRYFALTNGQELLEGDTVYAQELARHFLSDSDSLVEAIERLDSFSTQYQSINRLLPVYRLRFAREDKADIYVDTLQSRLATSNTQGRRILNWVFRYLHTWAFMGEKHSLLRLIPVTLLIGTMLAMGFIGLFMYGLMWKRLGKQRNSASKPLRRWHRRVALLVSISFIGFASSGLHTIIMKYQKADEFAFQASMAIDADRLKIDPLSLLNVGAQNFSLARIGDTVYFQLHRERDGEKHLRYVNAATGVVWQGGDAQYAEYLAKQASGLADEVKSVKPRKHFGHDYPVIFKRLPVQKVSFKRDDWLGYFIETQTGQVAGQSSKQGFFQAMHFQWLHKYHFLDKFMSRAQRDLVMTIIALLILSVVSMGGVLLFKRKA